MDEKERLQISEKGIDWRRVHEFEVTGYCTDGRVRIKQLEESIIDFPEGVWEIGTILKCKIVPYKELNVLRENIKE